MIATRLEFDSARTTRVRLTPRVMRARVWARMLKYTRTRGKGGLFIFFLNLKSIMKCMHEKLIKRFLNFVSITELIESVWVISPLFYTKGGDNKNANIKT